MKFTVARSMMARALALSRRAAGKRTILAPIDMVLLNVNGNGKLELVTTDLEIALCCHIPVTVQESGSTASPVGLLADLVKAFDDEKITAELSDINQVLSLHCGRDKAQVHGVPAQNFPIVPAPEGEATAFIAPDVLRRMINQVVFAASADESRPALTGVLLQAQGTKLTMVAADGYRLSRVIATVDNDLPEIDMIVPLRAIKELRQLTSVTSAPVALYVTSASEDNKRIIFHVTNGEGKFQGITEIDLVTKAIAGPYPNYHPLIPTSWTTKAEINVADLISALRPLRALVRAGMVPSVTLSIQEGSVVFSGYVQSSYCSVEENSDQGKAKVDAVTQGEQQAVILNSNYLWDALQSMKDVERVAIEVTTSSRPVVLKPQGDDDCLHLIMPMGPTS